MKSGAAATVLGAVCMVLGAACSEPEPVERASVLPAVPVAEEATDDEATLCVDTSRSLVRWKGTEMVGSGHEGVVRLAEGSLRVRDGAVTGGAFAVDMRTIAVTDIPRHEVEARRQLRSHLAHEEFFAVDRFPTARVVLTRVEPRDHGLYEVAGNLTIRDSTHNVTFEATAPVVTPEAVWATADFGIDRQLWGVDFDGRTSALRNAIVDDLIQLEVALVATAEACPGRAPVPEARSHGSDAPSPAPRAHHQLVRHPGAGLVYLIGGSTPGEEGHHYFDDVWSWNGERWSAEDGLPFRRSSHRLAYHPGRASLLLFGGTDGQDGRASGALWERREGTWSLLSESDRAATNEPGACWDRRRGRLVVYGGVKADGKYSASTSEWREDGFELVDRTGPGARLGHVLAWDPVRRRCLLFGGRDAEATVHGDTWTWDGDEWTELDVEGPPARWIHTATTDASNGRIVLFGGQDPGGGLLGDTWVWEGSRWTELEPSGPAPRMMGAMAPDGRGVVLFGGRARAEEGYRDLGDTWRLRNGRWTRLLSPAAEADPASGQPGR